MSNRRMGRTWDPNQRRLIETAASVGRLSVHTDRFGKKEKEETSSTSDLAATRLS